MPIVKVRLKFRWILPGFYLLGLVFYLGLMVLNIGHAPRGFAFLVDLLLAPCQVLDLFSVPALKENVIVSLIICFGSGLVTSALLGAAIDLIVDKIRQAKGKSMIP